MAQGRDLAWQATAAANILEARKRNGRLGARKSKQGCLTCKGRHVKCDETRPECLKCSSAGRKCDGYPDSVPSPKGKRNSHSLIGLQLSQSLGLKDKDKRGFEYFLSWTAPRLAGSLDKDFWCGQVLQLAQSEPVILDALLAISTLYEHPQHMKSFYTNSDFDEVTVPVSIEGVSALQTARSEIYSTENGDASSTAVHPSMAERFLDEHHLMALKYYNRAISGFMDKMHSGKGTALLALLTCALFICIEIMRDDIFSALKLFAKGMQLLRQTDLARSGVDPGMYLNLKLMFARLGVIAAVFGHPEHLELPSRLTEMGSDRTFVTVADARTALFALMTDGHAFVREASSIVDIMGVDEIENFPGDIAFSTPESHLESSPRTSDDAIVSGGNFTTPGFSPAETSHISLPNMLGVAAEPGIIRLFYGCDNASEEDNGVGRQETVPTQQPCMRFPSHLVERQTDLLTRLSDWYRGFESAKDVEDAAVASLLMYYHVSFIWLSSRLSPYQTIFDQFTSHFEEILRLAEVYIKCTPDRLTFSLEVGTNPPLYFVATKCRVPSLRRKALLLLNKAPQKEANWSAHSVAELAARIVSIEEEGLSLQYASSGNKENAGVSTVLDSILPPESARLHNFEILMNWPASRFEIRVTRYSLDPDGRRVRSIHDYPMLRPLVGTKTACDFAPPSALEQLPTDLPH